MDILGIDIAKAKFDAALLIGGRVRHAVFPNTESGFEQLLAWLAKQRPDPLRWPSNGYAAETSANSARFCRAQVPPAWTPPAAHLRELRELVRRCDALKAAHVQELNRQKSGFASTTVAASITAHVAWLDALIEAVMDAVRGLVAADPVLACNLSLLRTITGFGELSATILLAELPNVEPKGSPDIAEFAPKGLAAFAGEHLQANAAPGQVVHQVDQVAQVAAEPVQFTDHEGIAHAQRLAAGGKAWPVIPPAGCEVLVELRGSDAGREQGVALQVNHLGAVSFGDAHIADQHGGSLLHRRPVT